MKKIIIGITGASGSIYSKRLVEVLLKKNYYVHIIPTNVGKKVFEYETDVNFNVWIDKLFKKYDNIKLEDNNNLFAGVASGSYHYDAMIIVPCSMGTLSEISVGHTKSLLTRTADVALKEKRKLVIVPRETPFNSIHLENMLKLSKLGVSILPAMPGFYHKPKTLEDIIDFVVGKVLDHLDIKNTLYNRWED